MGPAGGGSPEPATLGSSGGRPRASKFEVTTHGGRRGTGIDAVQWAARGAELGVGEILLNSMDADGTKAGFDLELIHAVRAVVDVPIIASGGAGELAHFAPAVGAGADAVLAASVFHFGQLRIGEVKDALRGRRAAGQVSPPRAAGQPANRPASRAPGRQASPLTTPQPATRQPAGASRLAQRAAPTMPALFCMAAGTTVARNEVSRGRNLSALRLIPPPMMIRSGAVSASM